MADADALFANVSGFALVRNQAPHPFLRHPAEGTSSFGFCVVEHGKSINQTRVGLFFTDVFVPDFGMLGDVGREEVVASLVVEVDDVHPVFAEPVDAPGEGAAFADDHRANAELADEAGAIPTGGEGGDHDDVAIAALAASAAEGISLSVDAGIALLDTAVVAAAEEFARGAKHGRADGDPAFDHALIEIIHCAPSLSGE